MLEDMTKPSSRHTWSKLTVEERAVVNGSSKARCRTEAVLSKGPCRSDLGSSDYNFLQGPFEDPAKIR
jgi:hypothetical protein